jgi:DUF4097 and DUF4098 domain-containing protein YvlB
MPTFSTPQPIAIAIEFALGNAHITATDRNDTVVEVRPSDPAREPDVRAAEQTTVEYTAGRLVVKGPKQSGLGLFGRGGSVEIAVDVPTGSTLDGKAGAATFHSNGSLDQCRVRSGAGDIELDVTGPVDLATGAGTIAVDRVNGDVNIKTGSGQVRIREIDGDALIRNANGNNWVGAVGGDLRISAANGDVSVDRAAASVSVTTANGDVRLRDAVRGSASIKSGKGEIEIGIRSGTAARLDVHTGYGAVRNQLSATDSPEANDETLDVRARTGYGDIVIRRA